MALIGNTVAGEESMPAGPHTMPDGTQMEGAGAPPPAEMAAVQEEAELDDDAFEEALERVMAAAAQAIKTPEVMQSLKAAAAAENEAEAIATLALDIVNGLDDKSGESIPVDVLPAAAMGILGMIGEVIGSPQEVVGEAADLLIRKAAEEAGMSPEQVEAEMAANAGE